MKRPRASSRSQLHKSATRARHKATEAGGTTKTPCKRLAGPKKALRTFRKLQRAGMYPENVCRDQNSRGESCKEEVCTLKTSRWQLAACRAIKSRGKTRSQLHSSVSERVTRPQLLQRARHRATGGLREQDYVRFSSGQLALRGEMLPGSVQTWKW